MALIETTTVNGFETALQQTERPVLVAFWAPYCGACRFVNTELRALARHYDGAIDIVKLDVEQCPEIAERYEVTSIPQLTVIERGTPTQQHTGARSRYAIEAALDLTRFGSSIADVAV